MKIPKQATFFIWLVLAIFGCAPALQAVLIPVAEDTSFTAAGKINKATGKAVTLAVTEKEQAYLIFDLSTLPASLAASNIASARLDLYVSGLTTAGDLTVHLAINDWQEDTASVDAPGFSSGLVGAIPKSRLGGQDFH